MAQCIYISKKFESEVLKMSKTSFVFSNPYTQSVRRDDLAPFLEGLLTAGLDDDFEYTPILLGASTVPNSNMVTVVYAFRYEVEK